MGSIKIKTKTFFAETERKICETKVSRKISGKTWQIER